MGEGGGAIGRGDGTADEAVEIAQPTLTDAALHQIETAGDALQQIVEIVGNAAGELADRLHLLRLSQGFLGRAQFRRTRIDPRLQRGVQGAQRRLGFAAFDHLAGAFGHFLHEGDLVGAPVTDRTVIEVDDGPQAPGAQERHDQDGACVHGAGGRARFLFVAQRIGQQIGDHDRLARAEPVHDLNTERVSGNTAEKRLGAAVRPALGVVEHVLDRVEMAVAHARHPEEPAHQGAGLVQSRMGVAAAQGVAEFEHEGVPSVGEFRRADVDRGADRAVAVACGVEQALALGRDPADDAVVVPDRAVLHVVGGPDRRIQRGFEGAGRGFAILGVKACVEIVQRADRVG